MRSIFRRRGLCARNAIAGFTLVELAVVIAIVALLLGAILTPLATQHQLRKNKEAERELREIKEALIGFAITNGRLPWPDTDFVPDGVENKPAGYFLVPPTPVTPPCGVCEGLLPWRDLGIAPTDPWGRLYLYRVAPEFGYPVKTGQPAGTEQFDLSDKGDRNGFGAIKINTRDGNHADIVLSDDAAAVVVSLGSNGAGGTTLDLGTIPPALANTDESVNTDGTSSPVPPAPHFYTRQITLRGASGCSDPTPGSEFCEFDDLVIWIPRVVLINRMVEAGRLP